MKLGQILLCLILWHGLQRHDVTAESNQACMYHELGEKCSEYAFQIVKSMMAYFDQVNKESVNKNAEMESMSKEIKQLEEKVTKLQIENTIYKTKEDSMVAVLEELKNQKTAIVQQCQCEREKNQINEFKVQIKLNDKRIKDCESNLLNKEIRILKLEAENQNQTIKLTEFESMNEQKNRQIIELDANISLGVDIANKCDKLIREMKAQVNISNELLKAMETNYIDMSCIASAYTFKGQCNSEIAGPGWTVIQQRINGKVNFTRNWNEYKNGFGDFWDGDFFLGLEKIHTITSEQPHELYIHMEKFDGSTQFARYDEFAISGEEDMCRLSKLGKFSGVSDDLKHNKDMRFTTYDIDNDNFWENCATKYHGGTGWWYNLCTFCNLNGIYFETEVLNDKNVHWGTPRRALKHVKMMIRPKDFENNN